MSYRVQVQMSVKGNWHGNTLRFKTEKDATDYARFFPDGVRWMSVVDYRIKKVRERATHVFIDGRAQPI